MKIAFRYVVFALVTFGVQGLNAVEPWTETEPMLRSVATYLEGRTTQVRPDGKREPVLNEHNGWYYQTLLVLEGMERLAKVMPEEPILSYTARRLAYLKAQQDNPTFMANSHVRFFYKWGELWCTGLAPLWFERAIDSPRMANDAYVRRFTTFLDACPRVDQGLLANLGSQVRTDDAYLMAPAMMRLAAIENRPELIEDAIHQLLGFHRRLFQPQDRLYRHIWDAKNGRYAAAYWGRGNGWMALAHVDALDFLSKDHPGRAQLLANFQAQMEGVRARQVSDGGWRQVLDHTDSWVETSCTGMFVYAMARGVNEGWLDASYAADARKGWKALLGKIDGKGVSIDTCPGTAPGDLNYYLHRPQVVDDPHSYGPILLAGAEILRMNRNKPNTR